MEETLRFKVTIKVDAKKLFGTDCGGSIPYEEAKLVDILRIVGDEVENKDLTILVEQVMLEEEDTSEQLEMELEELSLENTALKNRISELLE